MMVVRRRGGIAITGGCVRRWLDDATGWLLLRLAVVLERTVAGDRAGSWWLARRNAAIHEAHGHGVTVEELATRLGLSKRWVRQVVNGRKAPVRDRV